MVWKIWYLQVETGVILHGTVFYYCHLKLFTLTITTNMINLRTWG